jgi:multisubunit Na+/H+ antiporter MnhB subunit
VKQSTIVDLVSRKLLPFILLFGLYLISFGHLSPGGGFQGGAVLSSGVLLLCLSRGVKATRLLFASRAVSALEMAAFTLFLVMAAGGMAAGVSFLGNFLPLGRVGEVPSAGFILFLNLVIGLEVGAGITLICFCLLKED